MRLLDLFSLSTRMFKVRPMRTFLTVLGVSVGIGTVLFLVSLGYGLQQVILNKITTADALLSLDVSPGTSGLITLNKEEANKIREIKEVIETSPVINLNAQLTMGELTSDGLVYAVDPSFFRLGGIAPSYGELFGSPDSREIVISAAGAKLFNLNPKQIIGKEVALTLFIPKINKEGFEEIETVKREEKHLIKGVVEDENASFIFLPINAIGDLPIDNYAELKVKVSRNEFMEKVRDEIIERGFLVSSLSDTIDQANKIFQVVQIILALFGLVALVVSAIGMFNTMTIALLERINEIGIMRSIGATSKDIKRLFLFESLAMGFLGGLGGVIIGYLGGEVTNFGLNLLAKNFGGQALNLFYRPPWFIGIIIGFSAFIGFLTGIYPSRRASKLNPLEALRYK
ncbi:ABC transporter permease [Candidatus Falkowbacteria bacterium]|nr:ABC transporter permease [Candidatus Falkowbacteria bacterium]